MQCLGSVGSAIFWLPGYGSKRQNINQKMQIKFVALKTHFFQGGSRIRIRIGLISKIIILKMVNRHVSKSICFAFYDLLK